MSLEVIRVDVVTRIEQLKATFSGGYTLLIEYDNRIVVDTKTQKDPFLCVKVKFLDAEQANLSSNPTHRFYGQIHLAAAVPEGSGVSKANLLLAHFYKGMQHSAFGSVRTLMAMPAPPRPHLGWEYYAMAVPFWSDQPS